MQRVQLHKCADCEKKIPVHRERCMDCVGGCNWIIHPRVPDVINVGGGDVPVEVPVGRRCGAKCRDGYCWKHSEHGRRKAVEKANRMRARRREREMLQLLDEFVDAPIPGEVAEPI